MTVAALPPEERQRLAAAYGVVVPPDLAVKIIPKGQSMYSNPATASAAAGWKAQNDAYWKNLKARAASRQAAMPALVAQGKTVKELAAHFSISDHAIYNDLKALGLTAARPAPVERPKKAVAPKALKPPRPPKVKPPEGPKDNRRTRAAARRAELPALVEAGKTAEDIAAHFGISASAIWADLKRLGLTIKAEPKPKVRRARPADHGDAAPRLTKTGRVSTDKAALKKAARAEDHAAAVRDRRRFKTVPIPFGTPQIMAKPDAVGSIFPTRVFDVVEHEFVLKDGASNSKIGGDVLKGHLKGARIFTLTLEERATCPRSCALWQGCYGNAMQHARRWRHGPELERAIRLELSNLCRTHPKVLVRLHVLGDFYSEPYAALWAEMLRTHPNLYVFGFTAHLRDSKIGEELRAQAHEFEGRHFIRFSGTTGRMGSFTLDFPTQKKRIGDAIVCPEQAEAMEGKQGRHCGNCCICWHSDLPIAFVEH